VPETDDRSVAFDRAADYYDRTRGLTEEGQRRTIELLSSELGGRGRVLEIGVGTGQLALPLRAAGVPVVGLDLAMPMLSRAVAKSGGPELPLVQADALRLPFADGTFVGAYFRWVLHLIPRWADAMGELVRVVRPGGVVVGNLGGYGGPRTEIQEHFAELAGVSSQPSGLAWHDWPSLDAGMRELGATPRPLPVFADRERDDLEAFLGALEDGMYSWTWSIPEEVRGPALEATRRWARERFGPLDQVPRHEFDVVWHAFDLPGDIAVPE
jgi:SAM-dependent methyltransferase